MTSSTEQFSASITPFEVPEQMRAFAEKGVSQARDNYAKFKDAAETHNGTMEAVFTTASQGASEYTAKLMEFLKANTTSTLDFTLSVAGRELEIDSRPSDAIALAVRSGAPIYAAEEVISESAIEFEHDVDESEDVVEKFKEFLDEVSPEDFAAGDS